ncbi:creatininase family protein [Ruegeria marina]|uniref:Creatinine amidohydrolase n=1 Tax=Ruegeria marina TaxID=639004 RepID=A0A1G6V011_9RHOB|nr:creatininase family protein [Ruegeria marina]SDD46814.1 creatinine amidohydrolase [Ruegeria marina]
MKRFWADYTSREFSELERERLIAVLPIGAIEQHGPHLPMSVDTCTVNGVVTRLAERLPDSVPVLFLPPQAVCKSDEHIDFPGTLTLSPETFIKVLIETGASVARSGVRKLVFLNGHGGNIPVMDIAARELRIHHGMMAFAANWFGFGMPDGLYSEVERSHGIHAGDMETSVMLALDPANVSMSAARDFRSNGQDLAERFRHLGLGKGVKPGWKTQDLNTSGACGEAHLATAEKGEATLNYAVERLVSAFSEIDSLPLAWLDGKPEW